MLTQYFLDLILEIEKRLIINTIKYEVAFH